MEGVLDMGEAKDGSGAGMPVGDSSLQVGNIYESLGSAPLGALLQGNIDREVGFAVLGLQHESLHELARRRPHGK